jgi:SAM-dependent methyltransferase
MSNTSSSSLPAFSRSAAFYDSILSARRRDYHNEIRGIRDYCCTSPEKCPPICHSVIDWGCGTGEHIARWPDYGWNPIGFDPSPEMVAIAISKGLNVHCGSILDAWANRQAQIQTCLFAAFSYATTGPTDLARALQNVAIHAPRGGYFVFDVINYSAAAAYLRPIERAAIPGLVRVMRKEFDLINSLVKYSIDYSPEGGETFTESHVLRAFTPREITDALNRHGFDVPHLFDPESPERTAPRPSSFYFMVVARKR